MYWYRVLLNNQALSLTSVCFVSSQPVIDMYDFWVQLVSARARLRPASAHGRLRKVMSELSSKPS